MLWEEASSKLGSVISQTVSTERGITSCTGRSAAQFMGVAGFCFFSQKHLCFIFAPCHTFFCVHGGGRRWDIDFKSFSVLSRKAFLTDWVAPHRQSVNSLLQFISAWMKKKIACACRCRVFVLLCVSVAHLGVGFQLCALRLLHVAFIWMWTFKCVLNVNAFLHWDAYVCVCAWEREC